MILCLPFLMFQGRAQEAIDLYLDTFPDAELLEIMHHPEGTEIFDPAAEALSAATPPEVEEADEPTEADQAQTDPVDDLDDDAADIEAELQELDTEDQQASEGEEAQPDQAETNVTELPAQAPAARYDDTAAMETVVDWETTLVATAQLKIGGQVLMIQDSLIKRDFDFTASMAIAVVVDTEDEFFRITNRLAQGGKFLMEPDEYDFAANFAWVQDRFGVTWQVNQPTAQTKTDTADSESSIMQAAAPNWS